MKVANALTPQSFHLFGGNDCRHQIACFWIGIKASEAQCHVRWDTGSTLGSKLADAAKIGDRQDSGYQIDINTAGMNSVTQPEEK